MQHVNRVKNVVLLLIDWEKRNKKSDFFVHRAVFERARS